MSISRRSLFVLLALLTVGGLGWALWPAPNEADRVRAVIGGIADGAEAGDVGAMMAPLGEGFVAESDGYTADKPTVRAVVMRQFLRRGRVSTLLSKIEVTVEGVGAHASFDAILAESGAEWTDVIPVDADRWHLEVDLRRSEDEWSVTRVVRSSAPLLP